MQKVVLIDRKPFRYSGSKIWPSITYRQPMNQNKGDCYVVSTATHNPQKRIMKKEIVNGWPNIPFSPVITLCIKHDIHNLCLSINFGIKRSSLIFLKIITKVSVGEGRTFLSLWVRIFFNFISELASVWLLLLDNHFIIWKLSKISLTRLKPGWGFNSSW